MASHRTKQKLLCGLGLIVLALVVVAAKPEEKPFVRTQQQPLPALDHKLPSATRFVILRDFDSAAVLDRETGLVWEKSPSVMQVSWVVALQRCDTLTLGNRMGWRLPTVVELTSLVDPSVSVAPMLPVDHPFENVQQTYWSVNETPEVPTSARVVVFIPGGPLVSNGSKAGNSWAWCVRAAGPGPDVQ